MKRVAVASLLLTMTLFAGAATAQPIVYSDTIAWEECITASLVWANEATTFMWTAKQSSPGGAWTYQYVIDVPSANIDSWILELSDGTQLDQISNLNWPTANVQVGNFNFLDIKGLPCAVYGIKFNNINSMQNFISFQSFLEPTWGDFFATDGEINTQAVVAFNKSFCAPDPTDPPSDGTINCKILRPEGGVAPTVIPEPGSMVLAMIGLLPALGLKLRKR